MKKPTPEELKFLELQQLKISVAHALIIRAEHGCNPKSRPALIEAMEKLIAEMKKEKGTVKATSSESLKKPKIKPKD